MIEAKEWRVTRHYLESVKVALSSIKVGAHMIETATVKVIVDQLTRDAVFTIESKILAQKDTIEKEFKIMTPKNWWQQLKLEKFPEWWLGRWPVKYTQKSHTVSIPFTVLMPDLNYLPDKHGRVVIESNGSAFCVSSDNHNSL